MTTASNPAGERAASISRRGYAKPQLKRFGTLAEVTTSVGDKTINADGGSMAGFLKTS